MGHEPLRPISLPVGERAAFVRAICEEPDEDGPRLVYADWLEEHGEGDWAQFIRLACTLAQATGQEPHRDRLSQEARGLWWKIKDRLYAELAVFKGFNWDFAESQRGLVEKVTVSSPKTLVAEVERIYSLTCLRQLTLHNPTEESLRAVLALPQMQYLKGLQVSSRSRVCDETIAEIVASPHLTRLRELGLAKGLVTDAGVRMLARSPLVERLTWLDLRQNRALDSDSHAAHELQEKCGDRCTILMSGRRGR
jgi:uncharacterized protein (TIGR02996 family)